MPPSVEPAPLRRLLDWFADCPPLPGALCRGHSETFDPPKISLITNAAK